MPHVPWWIWVVAGLILLVFLFRLANKSFRRRVRTDFKAYFQKAHPEVKSIEEGEHQLVMVLEDGRKSTMFLHRLYQSAADLKPYSAEQAHELFERFEATYREGTEIVSTPLQLAVYGERLLPRLVPSDFFQGVPGGKEGAPPIQLWTWWLGHAILHGTLVKRYTRDARGTRYKILGPALDARQMYVVCRFTELGIVRVITVYEA